MNGSDLLEIKMKTYAPFHTQSCLASSLSCSITPPFSGDYFSTVVNKKYDMKRFRSIAVYSDNEANLEVVKVYTETLK